ncbi:hypothetical protein JTE90_010026 [Oedothorax gibbosus]|uniref:Uncharacterized protein n=1 Tax=Oedothorax gibbosus TaxID=931172 RepID=A0AAV6TW35_9ARAC|nr:hypothetical protein JTE90_010026 [Oedothorax gibbosus]
MNKIAIRHQHFSFLTRGVIDVSAHRAPRGSLETSLFQSRIQNVLSPDPKNHSSSSHDHDDETIKMIDYSPPRLFRHYCTRNSITFGSDKALYATDRRD